MNSAENSFKPSNIFSSKLPLMISLGTFLIAIGTIFLHLVGDIIHRNYLDFWGVGHEFFPKKTDWVLINGYYGVINGFFEALSAIFNNLLFILLFAIILSSYFFVLNMPIVKSKNEVPDWLKGRPDWIIRLVRCFLLGGLFSAIFPLAFLLLTLFLIVPAAIAESIGKGMAKKELVEYKKGVRMRNIYVWKLRGKTG